VKIKIAQEESVSELQGLYGPLRILEGKIQQVWALREIQEGAWRTRNGFSMKVHQPGRWNRGAGPDFKEAVIELNGQRLTGDVEIHLYREDWWRHGHHLDPGYNAVVLHVVLFAGGIDREIRTQSGKLLEEWVMGPWIREDLEAVSGGEPGLFGELVPELKEWLESDHPEAIRHKLRIGAERRWQQKDAMARCFRDSFGLEGAFHRMILYYLGFPYNRRAFFQMAEGYPREAWSRPEILGILKSRWKDEVKWGLGRPANRAEVRLAQYVELNRLGGDWCARIKRIPPGLQASLSGLHDRGGGKLDSRKLRQVTRYAEWRKFVRDEILGGVLNQTLADRLWIDVFLPLLASEQILGMEDAAVLWFHSRPGSFPETYLRLLKLAGVQAVARLPLCNGWVQGLLWNEDQLRLERVRSTLAFPVAQGKLRGA